MRNRKWLLAVCGVLMCGILLTGARPIEAHGRSWFRKTVVFDDGYFFWEAGVTAEEVAEAYSRMGAETAALGSSGGILALLGASSLGAVAGGLGSIYGIQAAMLNLCSEQGKRGIVVKGYTWTVRVPNPEWLENPDAPLHRYERRSVIYYCRAQ